MDNFFSSEIGTIYSNLGILSDTVSPNAVKMAKVRELVLYLERRHTLDDLRIYLEEERPHFPWDTCFETILLEIQSSSSFTINEPFLNKNGITTLTGTLHDYLTTYFDLTALRSIAKTLGTTLEDLQGTNIYSKARQLILHCERNNMLLQLVRVICVERPQIFMNSNSFLRSLRKQITSHEVLKENLDHEEFSQLCFDFEINDEHLICGNTLDEKVKALVHQAYNTKTLFMLVQIFNRNKPNVIWDYSPDEIQYFLTCLPQNTIVPIDIFTVRGGSYRSFASATCCFSRSGMVKDRKADNLGFRVGFSAVHT